MRIAAALAIFGAGLAAGRLLPDHRAETPAASSPFLAAVEVQHTGSAYVQALARLDATPATDPAIRQGREAARATLAAAEQLVAAAPSQ